MSNAAEKISITVTPAMKRILEERVASVVSQFENLVMDGKRTFLRTTRPAQLLPSAKQQLETSLVLTHVLEQDLNQVPSSRPFPTAKP